MVGARDFINPSSAEAPSQQVPQHHTGNETPSTAIFLDNPPEPHAELDKRRKRDQFRAATPGA
jgi:hypothetical protein